MDRAGPPAWVVAAASALTLLCPAAHGQSTVRGAFAVDVSAHGTLVTVPPDGVATVDGPELVLEPGFAEWYGLSFRGPSAVVEGVGHGAAPDWADREPVIAVSYHEEPTRAVAVVRVGDLEVHTDIGFADGSPYLIAEIDLYNRGTSTLRDVYYTREWRAGGEGWTFPRDLPGLRPAPADVCRLAWMLDDIPPGGRSGLTLSYVASRTAGGEGMARLPDDVPLELWTHVDHPMGVDTGDTYGLSFGDYDADGYIDMFAADSGNLWRNLDGRNWVLAEDLDIFMPAESIRYGSSFGDYDNDGLPDIGTEPRGANPAHLLHNLGGGPVFEDVAADPAIVDVQPFGDSETICWGDVDCDGDLDYFLPVYPSVGNWFLDNQGPSRPGGPYTFLERSAEVGVDNPAGAARPEGAQFVDTDDDGDMDLYSNGTFYQNRSTRGAPLFQWLTEAESGIGLSRSLDEGAMFFDYDLDGDFDLFIVYTREGVRIWESHGDGSFFGAEETIIDEPLIGLNLGMSAEDWDNDGDVDFTTRQVFRRNQLIEEGGGRHFTVASHSITASHLTAATPSWGDWDHDGDLDSALGNWASRGHFYDNVLYGPSTPPASRRHLRVKAVRDALSVPAGLETEYGAIVEVRLLNVDDPYRRRKFVASGHGYLNQNEYTLHFALPDDPAPADPVTDVRLDVSVDFPSLPEKGPWRVDRFVNPVLGDVDLARLADWEIKVYRCGRVVKDGVTYDPVPGLSPRLVTTTGGLVTPETGLPLVDPGPAPGRNYLVGLAFDTRHATGDLHVKELMIDGQLGPAVGCGGGPFNVALFDTTVPARPELVGRLLETTSPRNRRTRFTVDFVLAPGRDYRLVARVIELRTTAIAAPTFHGPVTVHGGLAFDDSAPCSGMATAAAAVDPSGVAVAIRFSPDGPAGTDVGNRLKLVRAAGEPVLRWPELAGAMGYDILRCDATAGRPCGLDRHAGAPTTTWADGTTGMAAGTVLWYEVELYRNCVLP